MDKRFVSIWLPHLVTDWFSVKQPQLRGTALVVKSPSHGRMIITAGSRQAQEQGVHAGMLLADARAILPSLQVVDELPGLTSQLLQRIAEWAIRFTPLAAPDYPDGIILDASGCTHLWGSEEAYITDIINRLSKRGYWARIAVADTIGAAWAMARFGKAPLIVPIGQQQQALLSLPPAALRLESETTNLLHKLGLRQVKDFVSMPRTALRRRFGVQTIKRLSQALGEEEEWITPVYPPEPFGERLPCIEPIVTRTGIEIALQHLLEAVCGQLRKEGKGLRAAYFRSYRVDSSTQGIEISTSRPSHHEEHLFHLFNLKLSTIRPDEGIELFILEATKIEDYMPVQESFWEGGGSSLHNAQLSELLDRLAGKAGWDAIHRYLPSEHHLPERSFRAASTLEEQRSIQWSTEKRRPLQVLLHPEPIQVTAPVPDYPPMNFRYKGKLHKVIKADGPERIEQEWWVQEGEHRDYYCVEDEAGCRYWLFRLGHYDAEKNNQWFLHGFFA